MTAMIGRRRRSVSSQSEGLDGNCAPLYVGDPHPDTTEETLYALFSQVGLVASICACRDRPTRRYLGYAYGNFHSVQDAEKAIDTLNYECINGRSCRTYIYI